MTSRKNTALLCLFLFLLPLLANPLLAAVSAQPSVSPTQQQLLPDELLPAAMPPPEDIIAGKPASISYSSSSSTGAYTISWGSATNGWSYSLEESKNGGTFSVDWQCVF